MDLDELAVTIPGTLLVRQGRRGAGVDGGVGGLAKDEPAATRGHEARPIPSFIAAFTA